MSVQKVKPLRNWFIVLSAVVSITICSKSSPLYLFNDWMDINCFMTVGKSILQGMVPYVDIYEQKGPLLYLICAVFAAISDTNFIGFYLAELVAAFFFLRYSYQTMQVFCKKNTAFLVPLLACAVYSCGAFSQGGSVEEYCLPFLAYALWVGVKLVVCEEEPSRWEAFFIGVSSGAILWMKYSMLGFYLGWILVPAYLYFKKHKGKELLKLFGMVLCGVVAVSVPVLAYLLAKGALKDCFTAYFYNNIFLYSDGGGMLLKAKHILAGLHLSLVYAPVSMLLIVLGSLSLVRSQPKTFWFLLLTGTFAAAVIFSGGQGIQYYPLPLATLAPVGLATVYRHIAKDKELSGKKEKGICALLLALSATLCFFCSPNTYFLSYEKEDLPQYQFAEVVCQKENPTLLNYGFMDGGFYTTCGITPNCKYFCKLNINLEESAKEQDAYVKNGWVDFVVTRDEQLKRNLYDCISKCTYLHEGKQHTYYLYELKAN